MRNLSCLISARVSRGIVKSSCTTWSQWQWFEHRKLEWMKQIHGHAGSFGASSSIFPLPPRYYSAPAYKICFVCLLVLFRSAHLLLRVVKSVGVLALIESLGTSQYRVLFYDPWGETHHWALITGSSTLLSLYCPFCLCFVIKLAARRVI